MIREIIKPEYTNITINVPTSYIDREVEVLVFPIDEKKDSSKNRANNIKSLKGVFKQYADASKVPLEESAWKNHIIEKYSHND
jgi:hypothetical protein